MRFINNISRLLDEIDVDKDNTSNDQPDHEPKKDAPQGDDEPGIGASLGRVFGFSASTETGGASDVTAATDASSAPRDIVAATDPAAASTDPAAASTDPADVAEDPDAIDKDHNSLGAALSFPSTPKGADRSEAVEEPHQPEHDSHLGSLTSDHQSLRHSVAESASCAQEERHPLSDDSKSEMDSSVDAVAAVPGQSLESSKVMVGSGWTPSSSAPPSSRGLSAEGWSLEGHHFEPSSRGASQAALDSLASPATLQIHGDDQSAARGLPTPEIEVTTDDAEGYSATVPTMPGALVSPSGLASNIPLGLSNPIRSPSAGTSVSTNGAPTSEDYARCEEVGTQPDMISSGMLVGGAMSDIFIGTPPSSQKSSSRDLVADGNRSPIVHGTDRKLDSPSMHSSGFNSDWVTEDESLNAARAGAAAGEDPPQPLESSRLGELRVEPKHVSTAEEPAEIDDSTDVDVGQDKWLLRVRELEAQVAQQTQQSEEHVLATAKQIERLQGRIYEVEEDSTKKDEQIKQLSSQLDSTRKALSSSEQSLQSAKASGMSYEKQLAEARQEVLLAKQRARDEATKEKNDIVDEVRSEMEGELQLLMGKKDEQVKSLEAKIAASERSRREQSKELERLQNEVDTLSAEIANLREAGAGQSETHRAEIQNLSTESSKRVAELEARLELEERHKHELALNLRSVEERTRNEMTMLESEKSQIEIQLNTLQAQFQQEQQQKADLSISMGEAQQRIAELEGSAHGSAESSEGARKLAEAEAQDLRERLRVAEDKLVDAQSMRDMFSKETDMYRAELKVMREERSRVESELVKAQEKLREAQTVQPPPDAEQQSATQAMQKEFDSRMERSRDEIQYLRQKCDEKERRIENLLAERASLSGQLRSASGNMAGAWRLAADIDSIGAADGDVETGGISSKKKATGGATSSIRSLPLASPAWLRSSDEPLRLVVRTLSSVPYARIAFFTYVILLHVWVLFVMQQSAMQ
eukprot:TRINITY_DN7440_c0_g4_i1.p1 TRINITY_DN7440_c0_g4~~TRINITY_DN7440_c0_g4_i1.p1  ORF type:complete len:984 (-),score=174.94 TRINITY_DN7440_c0_g4_i1:136-3087(-)